MIKKSIIVFLTVFLLQSCFSAKTYRDDISMVHVLDNYVFDPSSALLSRTGDVPPLVLNYLKELDKRSDYSAYSISEKDKAVISDAFNNLPPKTKKILQERLIGIYFINNLLGSGLTEWVAGKDGKIYSFMVFNPSLLRKSFSGLMTDKERTAFIYNDKSYDIKIECGEGSGFQYILLHESTHSVDYSLGITPFADEGIKKQKKTATSATEFTRNIWDDYEIPHSKFSLNGKISFYGMGGGAKLNISDSPEVYKILGSSPFVSLYSSLSWAEDLAEFVTFYHWTEVMKKKYEITVLRNGKVVYSYQPMRSDSVKKRIGTINIFYK